MAVETCGGYHPVPTRDIACRSHDYIAELGDLSRFNNPRQLMSFLGLVPSEHSSGNKTKRGRITKTGNTRARRAFVEAAHAYRYPARISKKLLDRQVGLTATILDIVWKCQMRLSARLKRMRVAGKHYNTSVTAVASGGCKADKP